MNSKKVHLSKTAQLSFDEIIAYTRKEWGQTEFKRLKKRVKDLIEIIQSNPYAFKIHDDNCQIRKAILLDDISVFFKVNDTTIDILLFWHNSRNPEGLKL